MIKLVKFYIFFLIVNCTTVHIIFDSAKTLKVNKIVLDSENIQRRTVPELEKLSKEYSNLNDICPDNWTLLEVEFYRETPISGLCENRNEPQSESR